MADDVHVTNLSDSGSNVRVALDLMKYMRSVSSDAKEARTRQELIDLYVDCLWAVNGNPHRGDR